MNFKPLCIFEIHTAADTLSYLHSYSKASAVLEQVMLETKHKMAMHQLECDMQAEMKQQREELNEELEAELQTELEVRGQINTALIRQIAS